VILAIDTTHAFGSIALLADGQILEETLLHAEDGFGHVLYGHLSEMLDRRRLRVQEVDCFAAASGPGSFTGVRIGLACVKGLGEALQKPVAPVSNLQALAAFGAGPLRATLLDARRGEIYGAVYDGELNPVAPELVMKLPDWLGTLPAGPIEFITADLKAFRPALSAAPFPGASMIEAPRALAAAIARIAESRLRRGLAVDAARVDANYVRRSDAELLWNKP
jgi:tRNA threonylcarbamoyladenosine biosynthesis protein TsaB